LVDVRRGSVDEGAVRTLYDALFKAYGFEGLGEAVRAGEKLTKKYLTLFRDYYTSGRQRTHENENAKDVEDDERSKATKTAIDNIRYTCVAPINALLHSIDRERQFLFFF
jgi:hypothetical protein